MPNLNVGPPPEQTNDLGPPQLKLAPKPGDPTFGGGLAAAGPGSMANSTAAPAIGLAPQAPGQAGGVAPLPPVAPAIPAPTVAPPSAPVDRVKLATDVFNQSAGSTQGAYDAASRDNIHNSAALGQIGAGGLRTREGNLQLARGRDLDLMREKLVNDATTGSVADATTAFQQGLAGAQQGLATEIGKGNLGIAQGSLGLEQEKAKTAAEQTQQQIDLAKKAQGDSTALSQGQLDLQTKLGLGNLSADQQRIEIAKQEAAANQAYQNGTLDLAGKNQKLAELKQATDAANQQAQLDLAKKSQADTQGNETARIQLAKDQLSQTGEQFGLSLAQQKDLATLADKTANRQLDISGAQGQTSLALELARIMGSKDLTSVDPNFLAAIAKSLGLTTTGSKVTGGIGPPTDVKKQGEGYELPVDSLYHL